MKKLFLLLPVLFLFSFTVNNTGLTKKEKKFAAKYLKETHKGLEQAISGLTAAQMDFKPAADKWSIKECVYHLALSETNLWAWIDGVIKAPANPEKRSAIKATDAQVMAGLSDRTNKVKTMEPFEPKNAKWNTVGAALADLTSARVAHASYMKTTAEDLRNHVAPETPLGAMDAYQLILFMSAHTTRHTKQIEEIKADANFPKN
ncbi:MAG: hypothetical protein RLZZ316_1052 [Bacteroidota bacterium]|jgi:hypothetical protein